MSQQHHDNAPQRDASKAKAIDKCDTVDDLIALVEESYGMNENSANSVRTHRAIDPEKFEAAVQRAKCFGNKQLILKLTEAMRLHTSNHEHCKAISNLVDIAEKIG